LEESPEAEADIELVRLAQENRNQTIAWKRLDTANILILWMIEM
jgi:hypothetical protein